MQSERIFTEIDNQKDQMVHALMELIRIPAIGPENGGQGEFRKAERLVEMLEGIGFDRIERFDADDKRVSSGKRPNITAYLTGEDPAERLWIITHLDVVPPGEESLWTVAKPFDPVIKKGRIYGRGSEDNMQSMIASIFAAKALKDLGIRPKRTMALAFVADEEHGSEHGIRHLIGQKLFKSGDLIIVPDSGNEDGSQIEIAEKSSIWFRVRTLGKQAHASRPQTGLNAHRLGMAFAIDLDKYLHKKYSAKDKYFDPPESTIEPTKKDKNVDAVNIIPGEDLVYFDCRILPIYDVEKIIDDIKNLAETHEKRSGAKIQIELLQKNIAPKPTDPNAKVVTVLEEAIKNSRRTQPRTIGIGGGTCAAFFREIDIPAVVWSTIDETAHQPNEYAKIQNLTSDAKTFALLALL